MARIVKEGNYVTVTNEFIRSSDISFKAKGVFVYMASMREDWNFTIKSMAAQTKDGYDSVKTAIQELKELGYVRYEKHNNGKGTYYLTENPKAENPQVENPFKGKSTCIKKTNPIKKNNNTKKGIYEDFLKQLKDASKYKTKVTKTVEGEQLFKDIKDKGKLFKDYIMHQEDKKEFSVRITAFMLDYETVYNNQEEGNKVTW